MITMSSRLLPNRASLVFAGLIWMMLGGLGSAWALESIPVAPRLTPKLQKLFAEEMIAVQAASGPVGEEQGNVHLRVRPDAGPAQREQYILETAALDHERQPPGQ